MQCNVNVVGKIGPYETVFPQVNGTSQILRKASLLHKLSITLDIFLQKVLELNFVTGLTTQCISVCLGK